MVSSQARAAGRLQAAAHIAQAAPGHFPFDFAVSCAASEVCAAPITAKHMLEEECFSLFCSLPSQNICRVASLVAAMIPICCETRSHQLIQE